MQHGVLIQDWESQQICEVYVYDDGMYGTNHITNVKASNIDKHSLDLSWDKTEDVLKTIIYRDGAYYAQTEENKYTIDSGMLSNTEYIFSLEPVTKNTTEFIKNKKTSIKCTTKSNDVEFYIDGTNNITKKMYKEWFDADKNTYVDRNTRDTLKIKWTGDIKGKQIYVKTTGGYAGDFFVKFINEKDEVINSYNYYGNSVGALNWNSGESVTYVPEGATGLLLQDWESPQICEIGMFEDGKYLEDKITNVKANDISQHSLKLSWNKNNDVKKTRIYQDGEYKGETDGSEYTINKELMLNTKYIFYLEPIVEEETSARIKKAKIEVKTLGSDVEFYVDGTNEISKKMYKQWFDSNKNTYIDRNTRDTLKIKWTGDITGKQIYVKTTGGYAGDFFVKYINDDGNVIDTYTPAGWSTSYMNYNNGESVTYVPAGATSLLLQDWESPQICEIGLFESGKYPEDKITNVNVSDVTQHSLKLSWNKNNDVQKTKIYQDGECIGETDGSEYIVNNGLISNTEYIYYLEPIVGEDDGSRIKKGKIKVKTLSDGIDFQVDGTDDISKRYYKYWFDNDYDTCYNINSSNILKVKWTGNITRKKILVKTNGGYAGDFWVKYVDDNNNVINAKNINNDTVSWLNYNSNESITYVPEGATRLLIQDWESQNIYEIKIVE